MQKKGWMGPLLSHISGFDYILIQITYKLVLFMIQSSSQLAIRPKHYEKLAKKVFTSNVILMNK